MIALSFLVIKVRFDNFSLLLGLCSLLDCDYRVNSTNFPMKQSPSTFNFKHIVDIDNLEAFIHFTEKSR